MSLTAGRVLETGNVLTPRGRILYPALFTPKAPKGESEDKAGFGVTLLIPKEADLSILQKAFEETRDEAFSAKVRQTAKIKSPFLKTADQPRFAEYAEDYPTMIRFRRSKDLGRPDVVTPKGDRTYREEEEADEVYGGRWGRVTMRPFAFDHPQGGKGVSFGLQNVQMLDHADPMAGGKVKGTSEFDAVGADDLEDMA